MVVLSILFSDSPKGPGKRILAFSESLQWFLVWVWVFKVIFWYDIIHCFHQMRFTHAFTAWRKHANCFIIMSTIFYIILGYVTLKTFLCFEFNVFMLSSSGKICDIKLRIWEVEKLRSFACASVFWIIFCPWYFIIFSLVIWALIFNQIVIGFQTKLHKLNHNMAQTLFCSFNNILDSALLHDEPNSNSF